MRPVFLFPLLISLCLATANPGEIPMPERRLPPKGIAVPEADSIPLLSDLHALQKQAESLRGKPALADAEIYLNAVSFALENGEIFDLKELKTARRHLDTAKARLAEIARNAPPFSWEKKSGLLVRGFYSAIDGSAQPFGVEIPDGTAPQLKNRSCYLWLHGRGDKETNLAFIANRESKKGQFVPPSGTLVIHPFGRHCVGYKSAGEIDVLECLTAATGMYHISRDKVALMGFSMGGAGAWHLGAHYPDLWAVVHAGAGFVDVKRYQKLTPEKMPNAIEQTLWGLYDVPDYARNFLNLPLVAYSGEIDAQKAAADIMQAELATHGLKMQHFIGPKMGHKYDPAVLKQVQETIDTALGKGRIATPQSIHFQTKTLRYNRYRWLQVDSLERHWQESRLDAQMTPETVTITTKNITAFSLANTITAPSIEIDGQPIPRSSSKFLKTAGKWQPADVGKSDGKSDGKSMGLIKKHGLQGPMDDALLTPFLVVLPSGKATHPAVQRWTDFESRRFLKFWYDLFRGRARVKLDKDVTPADLQQFSIIAFGTPESNQLLGKAWATGKLPIHWSDNTLAIGSKKFDPTSHIPLLIHPNPLNPEQYLVVNNGCSFREGHCGTNSLQNPKLPDWAIIDLSTPPNDTAPGKIAAADFFDEQWQVRLP